MTENKHILNWINEMAAMTQPDKIVWIDGSDEQTEALREEACSTGEIIKLNEELLPNCYLHRTAVNDVARVEGRTYICTPTKEDAGNINNWMDPQECYAKLSKLYNGSMKGRTMYVIPYSMSVVGSDFAKYGIELTDSIYVVLNMLIMTRVGNDVLEARGLSMAFGERKLFDDISFLIKRSERVLIIGPNGCGKSTLIKIILHKLAPTAGSLCRQTAL